VRPYAIRQVCPTRQRGGPSIQSGATVPVLFCPLGRRLVSQVGGAMKLKVKWRRRAGAPRAGFFTPRTLPFESWHPPGRGLVFYGVAVTTLPALSTTSTASLVAPMVCCWNAAPASRIASKLFDQNAANVPLCIGAFLPRLSASA
jgi:hypothetical protein